MTSIGVTSDTWTERLPGRDGLQMSTSSWRGKEGPPCLFIHGFADAGYVWEPVVARLGNAGFCVAPDLAGHGQSDHDERGRYGLSDHATHVTALCSSLKLSGLVLVGHSLGGAIALHVAARGRVDVVGLVLIDCGPLCDTSAAAGLLEGLAAADRPYRSVGEYRAQLARIQPLGDPDVLDLIAARALRPTTSGLYVLRRDPAMELDPALLLPAESSPLWSALATVECPVLVLRGSVSAILTASAAERIERMGDDVRVQTIPRAGHAVMIDNPRDVAGAIDDFLATLPKP